MEYIQECTKRNEKLQIVQDDICEDPRNWDNLTIIATLEQNHNTIGDFQFKSSDELNEFVKDQEAIYSMPLYIYDHSGISLYCGNDTIPYPFNDQWDAGCIGMVFTTKKRLKGMEKTPRSKILDQMKTEVEIYSHYLNGNVYGFRLLKWSQCKSCDQEVDQEIESCYGFYGYDFDTNGLFDAILENSKVFKSYEDIERLIQ
tara:strand:+ start:372 stop:974 length:603 start_codon:yes stop_codon:yes gene_type:complete